MRAMKASSVRSLASGAGLVGALSLAACGGSVGSSGTADGGGTPAGASGTQPEASSGTGPEASDAIAADEAAASGPEASADDSSAAENSDAASEAGATTGSGTQRDSGTADAADATVGGPAAMAYVTATVAPGSDPSNGTAVCMFGQQMSFVIIGTPTAPLPTTVADGNTQAGAPVHVACSVVASGGGFDVKASATVEGLNGGTLTLAGHVTLSAGGTDLSATFTNANNGSFSQTSGCTVTYTGDPTPQMPAVAPGRIWGHLSCPFASRSDELAPNPDGGAMIPRTCDGSADFLFENCGT